MTTPDDPFGHFINQKRLAALAQMAQVKIAALIWGPAPSARTLTAETRIRLRDRLNSNGHHARFSEDLIDPASEFSVFGQQLTQAMAFDIIFSIPDSPGSIAEIHDFARIPDVAHKVVTFLDKSWNGGYANQSLIQLESTATCRIKYYDPNQLPDGVISQACALVRRLQECYFALGRAF